MQQAVLSIKNAMNSTGALQNRTGKCYFDFVCILTDVRKIGKYHFLLPILYTYLVNLVMEYAITILLFAFMIKIKLQKKMTSVSGIVFPLQVYRLLCTLDAIPS